MYMENFILSSSDISYVAKLGSGVPPSNLGCPRDPAPVWAAQQTVPRLNYQ